MSKKIWLFVGVDHAAITVTFLESESEVRLDIKFDSAETAVIIRTLVLHSSKKCPPLFFFVLKLEQMHVDLMTDSHGSRTIHPVIAGTLSNWCKILLVPLYFGDSLSMIPEAPSFSCRHSWSTLVFRIVCLAEKWFEVKKIPPLSVVHGQYFFCQYET